MRAYQCISPSFARHTSMPCEGQKEKLTRRLSVQEKKFLLSRKCHSLSDFDSSLWKRVIAWDLDWSRERLWDCLGGRDGKQTWRNVEQNVIAWLKQQKIAK